MAESKPILLSPSAKFCEWLELQKCSLAFTTNRSGDLFLVGLNPDGTLFVVQRSFDRAGAVYSDSGRLWLATRYQVWEFHNILPAGQFADGCDRLLVPTVGHTTGELSIQQMVTDEGGNLLMADSLFSTVSRLSRSHSFKPVWSPSFITALTPDDRCHLSGLATASGKLRFVTMFARTDSPSGWRESHGKLTGCVIDTSTHEVVVDSLDQPHSPTLHDGWLWLLEAGKGQLGRVHPERKLFEAVAFCPGYARGLAICGNYAIVGLSKPRPGSALSGMAEPRCGVYIVDLKAGAVMHWLRLPEDVSEIAGVTVLPGIKRPGVLGFQTDEIARVFSIEAV